MRVGNGTSSRGGCGSRGAEAKEIALDVKIDPIAAGTYVLCDRNRMQQIVGNLLSNAVKFCPKGCHGQGYLQARTHQSPDLGK